MANITELPTEEVLAMPKKVLKIVPRKATGGVAPARQLAPVKAVLPVPKPVEDEEPTTSGDVTIDRDALTQLKVDSLKDIIRSANTNKANIRLSGTKAELVERILESTIAKEQASILYSTFSKTNSKRTTTKEKPAEVSKPKKSPLKIRKIPSVRETAPVVEPMLKTGSGAEVEAEQEAHELLSTLLELKSVNEVIALLRAEISLVKGKKPLQVVDKEPSPVKVAVVVAKAPITLNRPKVVPKLAPLTSTAGPSRTVAVIKPITNKPVVVEKAPVAESESDDELPNIDFSALKSPQVDRNGADEYFNRKGAKQSDDESDNDDDETDDEEDTEETPQEEYDEADDMVGDVEPIDDDEDEF